MKKANHNDFTITTKDGQNFDIPFQGSLGLFALGDIGLMAWRNKKRQAYLEMKQKQEKTPKTH